ncbi:GntR family transcriptional regulator [Cytobacillus oceanisediminis]|uniref:GntR family transcriptional regulator n=1 Tax=Cytobacillus oceanisediminis TaxID=665099 RepID=UPI001863ADD1|nr:GntR family transcriptional regulator [Cytobacillus oceanisediminis]MBY0157221.1 GntR family transcriptional regulator [Cytobacillus firmus]QOK28120.1 GntR family transcriptional regulator [Cytobacillus oceanisediminis]USK46386.1 GntR family transcriptional regulator [Cytobacillus oceanisediminis]
MKSEKKAGEQEVSLAHSGLDKEIEFLVANLEGIDKYRLPQRAYHIARTAIRELILSPGQTILERELAEILQMSRTPVREALVRLETEGMVRLIPRRGFIVEPIEKEDLNEIYEIAEKMDGLAVEKATRKINNMEFEQLDLLIVEQEKALEEKDLKKWAVLDDEFHSMLIKFAGSKRMSAVVDIHSDQLYRARLFSINHRPIPNMSIVEHKAIISCMKAKDGAAARMVMQSHRNRARMEIIAAIEKLNQTGKKPVS